MNHPRKLASVITGPAPATSCASDPATDPHALVGQSIYDERHRKIGVIESIAATRDNGFMCMVTGTDGCLGIGRIPLNAITLIGDKLYRDSLTSRLRAMKW